MIDWRKTAELNGLSPDEFEEEILMAATALGAMKLDENRDDKSDCFKFSCSDEVGKIELYIRRV